MRTAAALAGLVGGLAWIAAALVGPGTPADALGWAGATLLAVAALAAGAGLVGSAAWLRAVSALGFLLLATSVVAVLLDNTDDRVVHGGLGAVAAVAAAVALRRLRSDGTADEPSSGGARRARGSHAR